MVDNAPLPSGTYCNTLDFITWPRTRFKSNDCWFVHWTNYLGTLDLAKHHWKCICFIIFPQRLWWCKKVAIHVKTNEAFARGTGGGGEQLWNASPRNWCTAAVHVWNDYRTGIILHCAVKYSRANFLRPHWERCIISPLTLPIKNETFTQTRLLSLIRGWNTTKLQ